MPSRHINPPLGIRPPKEFTDKVREEAARRGVTLTAATIQGWHLWLNNPKRDTND